MTKNKKYNNSDAFINNLVKFTNFNFNKILIFGGI